MVLGDREVHALGREVQVNTVERKARWKKILRFFQTGLTSLDENIGESVHSVINYKHFEIKFMERFNRI